MKLLIISGTPHYRKNEKYYGWGATVQEIDYLAELFDSIVHIVPLYEGNPRPVDSCHKSDRVNIQPVSPSGGSGWRSKLGIFLKYPEYIKVILEEAKKADVIHIRCPANIGLLAVFMLFFMKRPKKRWIKYAGNWQPKNKESLSYKVQRFLLRSKGHQAMVSVNGEWTNQPSHIVSFLNPCLTEKELIESEKISENKILDKNLELIYVGRLETEKGVKRTIEVLHRLGQSGVSAKLHLVGDGPEKPEFKKMVNNLGLSDKVIFHGWLSRTEINDIYKHCHFMLLLSECSEGWPKVISESMAYSVVPIASNVSSIQYYLDKFGVGFSGAYNSLKEFELAIVKYVEEPQKWKEESQKAVRASRQFSYKNYLDKIEKSPFLK